jgi:hypothetical protein
MIYFLYSQLESFKRHLMQSLRDDSSSVCSSIYPVYHAIYVCLLIYCEGWGWLFTLNCLLNPSQAGTGNSWHYNVWSVNSIKSIVQWRLDVLENFSFLLTTKSIQHWSVTIILFWMLKMVDLSATLQQMYLVNLWMLEAQTEMVLLAYHLLFILIPIRMAT